MRFLLLFLTNNLKINFIKKVIAILKKIYIINTKAMKRNSIKLNFSKRVTDGVRVIKIDLRTRLGAAFLNF